MIDKKYYATQYYEKNKDKYKMYADKNKTKVLYCECCKKNVKYMTMSSHKKSQKHKINEQNFNKNDSLLEEKIIKILRKLINF